MSRVYLDSGLLLVLLAIFFVVSTASFVLRIKKKQLIHKAFFAMLMMILIWSLGDLIMLSDSLKGLPIRLWAFDLAYIGLILTPVGVLFVGLTFARATLTIKPIYALALVVPALSIILLLTNPNHLLFYRYYQYDQLTAASALGPYFIFHTVYSYVTSTVGMGFLAYFSIKNAGFFSRQSLYILSGISVTFGFNVLETLQVIHTGFHGTVITFSMA